MAMHMPELPVDSPAEAEPRRMVHRYLRPPEPVHFPASEEMPETNDNLERRIALYTSLKLELAASATIGSDQFVYWNPTTAKKRLAPDVFVRLGQPHRPFRVWKIWERGAPEVGVEIISHSDDGDLDWSEKLVRYRAAGIGEVVRFDAEDADSPIRIWDMIDGDLVERAQDDPNLLFCEALRLWWVVVKHRVIGPMLRLSRDREGVDLLSTSDELTARARAGEAMAREGEARSRKNEARMRENEARMRENEARMLGENERLQVELAALRAQIEGATARPRKRRT